MTYSPSSSQAPLPGKGTGDAATDQETFARTLDHAKLAFANTQEVIRFVDVKASVLIGLSTIVSGAAVALAKWNFGLPSNSTIKIQALADAHPALACTAVCLFALSLVGTVASYLAASWSMIARPAAPGSFTILYPVPRDMNRTMHEGRISELLAGMSREEVLFDFRDQLPAVGRVLQTKQKSSRMVAIIVITQVALLTAAVIIYFCLAAKS